MDKENRWTFVLKGEADDISKVGGCDLRSEECVEEHIDAFNALPDYAWLCIERLPDRWEARFVPPQTHFDGKAVGEGKTLGLALEDCGKKAKEELGHEVAIGWDDR